MSLHTLQVSLYVMRNKVKNLIFFPNFFNEFPEKKFVFKKNQEILIFKIKSVRNELNMPNK